MGSIFEEKKTQVHENTNKEKHENDRGHKMKSWLHISEISYRDVYEDADAEFEEKFVRKTSEEVLTPRLMPLLHKFSLIFSPARNVIFSGQSNPNEEN